MIETPVWIPAVNSLLACYQETRNHPNAQIMVEAAIDAIALDVGRMEIVKWVDQRNTRGTCLDATRERKLANAS